MIPTSLLLVYHAQHECLEWYIILIEEIFNIGGQMSAVTDDYDQNLVALKIDENQASVITDLRNTIMQWKDNSVSEGFQLLERGEITEDEYRELEERLYNVQSQSLIYSPITTLEEAASNPATFVKAIKDEERGAKGVFNDSLNVIDRTIGLIYHDDAKGIVDSFLEEVNKVVTENFKDIRKDTLALSQDEIIGLIKDQTQDLRIDLEKLSAQIADIMQEMEIGDEKEAMGKMLTIAKAFINPQDAMFDVFKDVVAPKLYDAFVNKNK